MKKNKMMRLASVLLVAVLLTTSAISGTFAKYVTQDSANDTARVAKWGVILQVDGKLYGQYYGTGETKPTTTDTAASLSVMSSADNLVAPGTANDSGFGFSLNGTPEVRTNITATIKAQNIFLNAGTYGQMVEATVNETSFPKGTYYVENAGKYEMASTYAAGTTYYTLEDLVTTGEAYYPVVYASTDVTTNTCKVDSINLIAADIAQKLNGAAVTGALDAATQTTTYTVNAVYDPNKDLSELNLAGEKITWAWAFEEATNVVVTEVDGVADTDSNDEADTILALLKTNAKVVKLDGANYGGLTEFTDYCLNTSFSMDITITQVD